MIQVKFINSCADDNVLQNCCNKTYAAAKIFGEIPAGIVSGGFRRQLVLVTHLVQLNVLLNVLRKLRRVPGLTHNRKQQLVRQRTKLVLVYNSIQIVLDRIYRSIIIAF